MRIRRDRRRSERTVEPLLETLNQGRVRGAQSAPQTDARLSNWGSFGLRQARLCHHFRPWKMTYHDLNVKMGESGRVRLKWPGIAVDPFKVRQSKFKKALPVFRGVGWPRVNLTPGVIYSCGRNPASPAPWAKCLLRNELRRRPDCNPPKPRMSHSPFLPRSGEQLKSKSR